jgi:hypothetical protein
MTLAKGMKLLRLSGMSISYGAGIAALCLAGSYGISQTWFGSFRLLSIQDVGESCYRPSHDEALPQPQEESLFASFHEPTVRADDADTVSFDRPPVRNIWDTAPVFSSVSVDTQRNEVYLQDSNRWSIRVFGRLDNTKPGEPPTEPRRIISGRTSDV